MPLNLQKNLPAIELLKKEHIFVMDSLRASTQDIRPLRVVVLNLMPLKITTETDLVRLLSNTPLQVELDFMKIKGHTPKNTPIEHMKEFYKDFEEMKSEFYDGMIVTGAPVEQMPFEEVSYWGEIQDIFPADLRMTAMRHIELIVEAPENRQIGTQQPMAEHTKHLFGQVVLGHTEEMVESGLSRPTDI